jgi:hypothetical protein
MHLEELLKIYANTDPRLGSASEQGKDWDALWAIRQAHRLTHLLTDWAENHIAGKIYRWAHIEDKSTFDADSHANEHEIYGKKDGLQLTAEQYRQYIAVVLEQSAYPRHDWREKLSESLLALNEGESQFLTKPSKTAKHGRPYTLRSLRWLAVLHVHVLVGTGLKKHVAEDKVASALRVQVETLRAWEKQFLKTNADLKRILLIAQTMASHDLHDFENPWREKAGRELRGIEDSIEWTAAYELRRQLREHPVGVLARELLDAKAKP